ncbi:hypothetical protein [Jiella sonneratiae]|uniref:HEPN domain-containing protein n=1 Tax=Jiella sonneratiae TaxID=2816856 RepID=A0ABS3J9G6_9HYPH|nr:hypothetical protein [Jiella sonneratiae]MBO0906314.1 hypothetical protein [Jiella sonneratiae]
MDTPEDWWRRVEDKRAVAARFKDDRKHAGEAWHASGSAVEFALKACILRREGWNRWPDRSHRPDLYVHDLGRLFAIAQISHEALPAELRASLRMVLSWRREHEYNGDRVPRRVARQMFEAAFGPDGVIEWLKRS